MKFKFLVAALFAAIISVAADSYQHIRNATARINYAGATFLIDPYLAKKGQYEGFKGTLNSHLRNPLVELPMSANDVFKGVDAIVLTHTHADHRDEEAVRLLPKDLPIFVQNSADAALVRSQGFSKAQVIYESVKFKDVEIIKTGGAHGTTAMYSVPALGNLLGDAMGVVFRASGHESLYIAGDTLWTADAYKAINRYNPQVIVLNTGYAQVEGFKEAVIMGTADVVTALKAAPKAKIITVHMDAVNHASVSRADMRKFIKEQKLGSNVIVPNDGEKIEF